MRAQQGTGSDRLSAFAVKGRFFEWDTGLRRRSEVRDECLVTDTIHTPGAKVAKIKRRKRRPNATEPAEPGY